MNAAEFEKIAVSKKYHNIFYTTVPEGMKVFKNSEVILGFDVENGEIFMGCNSANSFIQLFNNSKEDVADTRGDFEIRFVPEDLELMLVKNGFYPEAEFADYWIEDLQSFSSDLQFKNHIEINDDFDAELAEEITVSCSEMSRGFAGESIESLSEWKKENQRYGMFIYSDKKAVGFMMLGIYSSNEKTVCWIREIAVRPDYQGNGYGRQMLVKALQWGKEKGADKAFLAVDVENDNALSLYTSLGFERKTEGRGQINMSVNF